MGRPELRPETPADRAFLCELYASTREEELAKAQWGPGERESFLDQQFEAQWRHYHDPEHYGGCRYLVVELGGKPVGKAYLHPREDEIRLVDLALAPAFRGQGLGGQLLARFQRDAREAGLPLRFMVERENRALRLYKRAGFTEVSRQGLHILLEWSP